MSRTRNRLENGTPRTQYWGVDSEYGALRDVLIGPAQHYQWQTGNAIARRSLRRGLKFDSAAASAQYNELVDAFRGAGVTVHQLGADAALPYQLYARDSSVMTPWGALITQTFSPWRRGEWRAVVDFYLHHDIPIYDVITAGSLEGGDLMFLKPGLVVCGCSGERTDRRGLEQLEGWIRAEGWEFISYEFDPFYLHLDVKLGMLEKNLAVVCKDALEPNFVQLLIDRGIELIDISLPAALDLGCNVVALGNERIITPSHNTELIDKCRSIGLQVLDPDISIYTAGGGGVHCMTQPLRRDQLD